MFSGRTAVGLPGLRLRPDQGSSIPEFRRTRRLRRPLSQEIKESLLAQEARRLRKLRRSRSLRSTDLDSSLDELRRLSRARPLPSTMRAGPEAKRQQTARESTSCPNCLSPVDSKW